MEYEKGEGGGLSRTCFKPCFPACGKKTAGTFCSQKSSRHTKFQWILSNLENRYEIVTSGGMHGALQLFPSRHAALRVSSQIYTHMVDTKIYLHEFYQGPELAETNRDGRDWRGFFTPLGKFRENRRFDNNFLFNTIRIQARVLVESCVKQK